MKKLLSTAGECAVLVCACLSSGRGIAQPIGYVTDVTNSQLVAVDLSTAEVQVVGPFVTVDNIGGLAYDPLRKVMFGVSPSTGSLYSLSLETGRANFIGSLGLDARFPFMHGAAYDPFTDLLYGADTSSPGVLYTINPDTGAATSVGAIGVRIGSLAINPLNGEMYGSVGAQFPGPRGLLLINKATLGTTLIGTDSVGYNGLAFDMDGILYGVRNDTDSLYRLDTTDGTSTFVVQLGISGINPLGFEIVRVPEPAGKSLTCLGILGLIGTARPPISRRAVNRSTQPRIFARAPNHVVSLIEQELSADFVDCRK